MSITVLTRFGEFTYTRRRPVYGVSVYRAKREFGSRDGRRIEGDIFPVWHCKPFADRVSPILLSSWIANHLGTFDLYGTEIAVVHTVTVIRQSVPPEPMPYKYAGEFI